MRPFRPHPLLRNPHAQTLLGTALRSWTRVPTRRERLDTPDGDFLHLDWARGRSGGPIVLLLHGLAGSARSGFVQTTMRRLGALPVRTVGLNLRGCSGVPNRTRTLYHSGKTDDLDCAVARLLAEPGEAPLALVGYSLGGNLLLKWLGEQGDRVSPRIRCAAALSVPYDLEACAESLETGPLGRFYRWSLVRQLMGRVRDLMERHPGFLDPQRVAAVRTFRDFDEEITAPLHGFAGAEDYWRRCSSRSFLETVRRPTLLLSARDDPFLPEGRLPRREVESNPFLEAEFVPHGGHLGFVGPGSTLWAEERVAAFLEERLLPRQG